MPCRVMTNIHPKNVSGRYGSAAIDLAYVAAGRLDGFWELYLAPWDVAAGSLVVTEAGGRATDISGGNDYIHGQSIIASNGIIHELIRENLDPFTQADCDNTN